MKYDTKQATTSEWTLVEWPQKGVTTSQRFDRTCRHNVRIFKDIICNISALKCLNTTRFMLHIDLRCLSLSLSPANLPHSLFYFSPLSLSTWLRFTFFSFFIGGQRLLLRTASLWASGNPPPPKTINRASWQLQRCGNEMWTYVVTKLTSFPVLWGLCQQEVRREGGEGWVGSRGRPRWWEKKATADNEVRKLGWWRERWSQGV